TSIPLQSPTALVLRAPSRFRSLPLGYTFYFKHFTMRKPLASVTMRSFLLLSLTVLTGLFIGCGSNEPASPLQTFKTYTKAVKQKDTESMKVLLSNDTIKMHEQEAKAQGVSLNEIIKRETLI